MSSTKSKEILDLSMSFDEKLQIVENPVSHELVAKLVAQVINLEKEVRQLKTEMKAIKSSSRLQRPDSKSLTKHQVYFAAPVDVSTVLDRVSIGLLSAMKSGCIRGEEKCAVSIVGANKEDWRAVRLEFTPEKLIGYKVEMRDAIAQYPSSEMGTVQPQNVKLYGTKAAKPVFTGTLNDAIRHMSKT